MELEQPTSIDYRERNNCKSIDVSVSPLYHSKASDGHSENESHLFP